MNIKNKIKIVLATMLLGLFTMAFVEVKDLVWNTDFETSKKMAEKEGKLILLSFSGSDWCGACIRLDKTFFQSNEFREFAPQKFILHNADFPMKKKNKLSDDQNAENEKLSEQFNKKGLLPTVVVLNAKGELLAEMKYPQAQPADYIRSLEEIINAAK